MKNLFLFRYQDKDAIGMHRSLLDLCNPKLLTAMLLGLLFYALTSVVFASESVDVPFAQERPDVKPSSPSILSFSGLQLSLGVDYTYRRPAVQSTFAYVSQSVSDLQVVFDVHQSESVNASQITNSSSVLNDDYVGIELNPNGSQGFSYAFYSNARGARYQTSSENSSYAPQWAASATRTVTGYTVAMTIPLRYIRAQGSHNWSAQFLRFISSTSALSVWAYSDHSTSISDPSYFGSLKGIGIKAETRARPASRIQPYFLGENGSPEAGGSFGRFGVDVSLPIAASSSFIASIHPDYSNVEIDQQTIAPTAFARQVSEVRPFFTQAGSFFGNLYGCDYCPTSLYTPAIPKFREGFALEGASGNLNFAAFDASGTTRTDSAETVNYTANDAKRLSQVSLQRVDVRLPGTSDTASTVGLGYLDKASHLGGYLNVGTDRGTGVSDPKQAIYIEGGPQYQDSTSLFGISYQQVGAQYAPVDGFVAQQDIQGYILFGKHTFNLKPNSAVHDVFALASYVRQWNRSGKLAEALNSEQLKVNFKNLTSVQLATNDLGTVGATGPLLPFNSNGITLGYKTNTNTPSYISFNAGLFYHGMLTSSNYVTNLPIAPKVILSLEVDQNHYFTSAKGEDGLKQGLQRIGLDWQISHNAELSFGGRRIIGRNLPNSFQPLDQSDLNKCRQNAYYPGCLVDAGNLSFAFHLLTARNEFFSGYGDPSSLITYPAFYLKWIRYIGAEKGS